jgi:hypothetical protein
MKFTLLQGLKGKGKGGRLRHFNSIPARVGSSVKRNDGGRGSLDGQAG